MPSAAPAAAADASTYGDLRTEHDDQATTELSRHLAARLQFP